MWPRASEWTLSNSRTKSSKLCGRNTKRRRLMSAMQSTYCLLMHCGQWMTLFFRSSEVSFSAQPSSPCIVNWCIQSQKNPQSCDPAIYVHIIMTCTHACAFVCCSDTASLRDPLNKYKSRAPLVRQYILIDWFTHGEECMFLRLYIFTLSYILYQLISFKRYKYLWFNGC